MQISVIDFAKYDKYLEWLKTASQETIVVTRHEACITLGSTSHSSEILETTNLPVYNSNRGGGATYHDLGQLVLYPHINLRKRKIGVTHYIQALEQWVSDAIRLLDIEVECGTQPGLWFNEQKVAFIGIAVRSGFTQHGIAINLKHCQLENFAKIVPCRVKQPIGKLNIEFDQLVNVLKRSIDIFHKKI